ncbi:MAG: permease [Pseudomonadota bacterium]
MAEISSSRFSVRSIWSRIDGPWAFLGLLVLAIAIAVPQDFWALMQNAGKNLAHTSIFIAIAVGLIAYLGASGAEAMVSRALQGNQYRMVVFAALVGGLAPFCSCEVIPFIAALLALGTPLAAVMAFWLASPIMDPAMFAVTTGALGFDFALAKTIAAVFFGIFGGFMVLALTPTGLFADPLKPQKSKGCGSCCGTANPFEGKPMWAFWKEDARVQTFKETAIENALFLLKWLALAYVLEALMIFYMPADFIATFVGGDGVGTTIIAAFVGAPAYLNGFAAAPLIAGLIDQGMGQSPAMAFMLAGSVTSIPAMLAVWALVKPRVFFSYLVFGFTAATLSGLTWGYVSTLI